MIDQKLKLFFDSFQCNIRFKFLEPTFNLFNETLNVCGESKNFRSSFLQIWVPSVLKSIKPPVECPVQPKTYNLGIVKNDASKFSLSKKFKHFKKAKYNVNVTLHTSVKGKMIQILKIVEIGSFKFA